MILMEGKLTSTLILVVILGAGWGFMQMRVGILGKTPQARQRSQRNALLLGGMFGILVAQTWAPSSASGWIALAVFPVIGFYIVLMFLQIRRSRQRARVAGGTPSTRG
jgi:preprotein translocase subunit YajC